jgi:hypothetical protein
MAVAVAFVAWLGWINLRGSGSGVASTASGSASPSGSVGATTTASPTADPAQAQVEAAARRWVQAYDDAYKTGDAKQLAALDLPGSQADGESGAPFLDMRQTGKTFLTTSITYDSLVVQTFTNAASADMFYTALGQDAAWPSLQIKGPARQLKLHFRLTFVLINGQWLVDTVH